MNGVSNPAGLVQGISSTTTIEQIGVATAVDGMRLTCRVGYEGGPPISEIFARAPVGVLVKIPTPHSIAYGFIGSQRMIHKGAAPTADGEAVAEIDLFGEVPSADGLAAAHFMRGVSIFHRLGTPVFLAGPEDLGHIYARPTSPPLTIGTLYQDVKLSAYLMSQEFLSKHSAVLGTTGSGKSCVVTLIFSSLLAAHPNGHIVVLDPHNEYGAAFSKSA